MLKLTTRSTLLITGATGFVGSALLRTAQQSDKRIAIGTTSRKTGILPNQPNIRYVGDIAENIDWKPVLQGVDCVVHLAARVHVMNDKAADPLEEFHRVNVQGTFRLAQQAAESGVKRFVFLSTIKVNGESTLPGQSFHADDGPNPQDAYAISKFEAEKGLQKISKITGMELVIVRPPLVYGPGVKANFASMQRWLESGIPLPLGAISNKRSLVALDNLVDLILTCVDHPSAANQVFLASDGDDVSTTELLYRFGTALGKPARLIAVPQKILEISGQLLGKGEQVKRLCGSLQVDIEKNRKLLNWIPIISLDEGLKRVCRAN